jgi:hypothetical protein
MVNLHIPPSGDWIKAVKVGTLGRGSGDGLRSRWSIGNGDGYDLYVRRPLPVEDFDQFLDNHLIRIFFHISGWQRIMSARAPLPDYKGEPGEIWILWKGNYEKI